MPFFPLANPHAPHSHLLNCLCPSFPPFVLISSTPVPLVFTGSPPVPLFPKGSPCASGSHLLPSLTELRQETFLAPLVLVRHPRSQDTLKLTYHSQAIGSSFCSTYIYFSIRCMVVMKVLANGSFLGPTIKM